MNNLKLLGIVMLFVIQGCTALISLPSQKIHLENSAPNSRTVIYDINRNTNVVDDTASIMDVRLKKRPYIITYQSDSLLRETEILYPRMFRRFLVGNLTGGALIGIGFGYGFTVEEGRYPLMAGMGLGAGSLLLLADLLFYPWHGYNRRFAKSDVGKPTCIVRPVRSDEMSYLKVDHVSFNVEKDSIGVVDYKKVGKYLRENGKGDLYSSYSVKLDRSFGVENQLNIQLDSFNLLDTNTRTFGNTVNSLYLDCDVRKLLLNIVEGTYTTIEMTIDWQLKDGYKRVIFDEQITMRSNDYVFRRLGLGESGNYNDVFFDKIFTNALQRNLAQFVNLDSVRYFMTTKQAQESLVKRSWETLKLPQGSPVKGLNKLSSAMLTVVTTKGHGSGVVISDNNLCVTNFHVTDGAEKVMVIDNNNHTYPASVLRTDPVSDLALIRIDSGKFNHVIMDTSVHDSGETVYAIGTPLDIKLGQTISKGGIVDYVLLDSIYYYQTSVSVNPGNSGGGLVTKDGLLIGIVNAKLFGENITKVSYAMPARLIFSELKLSY